MKKMCFLSSFILKVVALVTMTIDHVGLFLATMYPMDVDILDIARVFRIIGRLALPLFVFMIVEGVLHTKNFKRYISRLLIMAGVISIAFIVLEYSPLRAYASGLLRAGNIFLDLSLLAIAVYLLKQPKIWMKFLTLLPLGFSILSFVVKGMEYAGPMDIYWFPAFLTLQYDWFSIVLGLGFYAAYLFADLYIKALEPTTGMDKSIWIENGNYRVAVNLISMFVLFAVSFFYYDFKYIWPEGVFWSATIQAYAIISGAFILLYNGQRGYNAKWFQYGSYLYYPLHIIAIIIPFIIINGGL